MRSIRSSFRLPRCQPEQMVSVIHSQVILASVVYIYSLPSHWFETVEFNQLVDECFLVPVLGITSAGSIGISCLSNRVLSRYGYNKGVMFHSQDDALIVPLQQG